MHPRSKYLFFTTTPTTAISSRPATDAMLAIHVVWSLEVGDMASTAAAAIGLRGLVSTFTVPDVVSTDRRCTFKEFFRAPELIFCCSDFKNASASSTKPGTEMTFKRMFTLPAYADTICSCSSCSAIKLQKVDLKTLSVLHVRQYKVLTLLDPET